MAVFLRTDVFSPFSCLMAADTTGGLTSDTRSKKDCDHKEEVIITSPDYFRPIRQQKKYNKLFEVMFTDISSQDKSIQVLFYSNLKKFKSSFKKGTKFCEKSIQLYCNPLFYGNWNSQDDIDPKNSKLFEATQQHSVRFQMQGIVDQMTATIPDDQKSSAKSLKLSTRLRVASEPKV